MDRDISGEIVDLDPDSSMAPHFNIEQLADRVFAAVHRQGD